MENEVTVLLESLTAIIAEKPLSEKIDLLNAVKERLHDISPFRDEPVDCVTWKLSDKVVANDYNPNKVAPPEMQLLEISILNDGYTQPVVTWPQDDGTSVVIDGFHRTRVGTESSQVRNRVQGYLPTVAIRNTQAGKNDRIASTIRHNRARGKHQIDAMSDIVIELKNRNWKNARIARELGMDEDEVLRLCQISGLGHLFQDADFSRAWESSDSIGTFDPLTDEVTEEESSEFRTINTDDPNRVFHTYDKWECHKAGLYATKVEGLSALECETAYKTVLANPTLFSEILEKLIVEWEHSCQHYLTNTAMNRIAWLGQAAVCYHTGVPAKYMGGWNLLTPDEQNLANEVALKWLNVWLTANGLAEVDMSDALSVGRQVTIY